ALGRVVAKRWARVPRVVGGEGGGRGAPGAAPATVTGNETGRSHCAVAIVNELARRRWPVREGPGVERSGSQETCPASDVPSPGVWGAASRPRGSTLPATRPAIRLRPWRARRRG